MKKGSKPTIVVLLLLLVLTALTILSYVAIKRKCEVLTREKVLAEESLDAAKNRRVSLLADFQVLASQERITNIALSELGMIKRTEPAIVKKADREKIERISRVLKDKYE